MGIRRRQGFANATRRAMPAVCLVLASAATVDDGSRTGGRELTFDAVGSFPGRQSRDCHSTLLIATGQDTSYTLTSLNDGVRFDFDGDGTPDRISWTPPNSEISFLAIDRDKDGAITSGSELVGKYSWPGVESGFAALADMNVQTNGNPQRGTVRSDDPLFSELLLWTDSNHDARSQPTELRPLADRVADVGLAYRGHHRSDIHGNQFAYRGFALVRPAPGRNRAEARFEGMAQLRHVYDVCFVRE